MGRNNHDIAQELLYQHSYQIICDLLGFEAKKNHGFVFSDDSKEGNDYIFKHPDGFYGIKNFATDTFYSAIQAYQFKNQCDFTTAINELGQKHLLHTTPCEEEYPVHNWSAYRSEKSNFKVSIKTELDDYDIAFWSSIGIPNLLLKEHNVHSLNSFEFWTKGSKVTISSSAENPVYAYKIAENCFKIYQPFQEKKRKFLWLGDQPKDFKGLFGTEQIPDTCQVLIICEGYKDALAINANKELFGSKVYALGKDNAQADLDKDGIDFLRSKADEVVLCMDNDDTGKMATKKHSAKYQLKYIDLPKVYHCKDIAEILIKYHEKQEGLTSSFFKNLVAKAKNREPYLPDFDNLTSVEKVDFRAKQVMRLLKNNISFRKPLLMKDSFGVLFPHTINLIQGGTGVHKSRLAEMICSALLCQYHDKNFLGFHKTGINPDDICLIHVDTERNVKDQYPFAIQQMIENAGYSKENPPSNLCIAPLVDINREERFSVLEDIILKKKSETDKHIVIVLDVVTDCILNFNDPKESMKLVDMMNKMINHDEVTFICIIHENFGVEKARGHLGSEISNKSTTIIQVKREDNKNNNSNEDIFKVRFIKTRMTKKPSAYYIYYSQTEKRLAVIEDQEIIQSLGKETSLKAPTDEVLESLALILDHPMNQGELITELCKVFDVSQNTIINRLKDVKNKVIAKDDKLFEVMVSTKGRSTVYELVEIKKNNNQTSVPI